MGALLSKAEYRIQKYQNRAPLLRFVCSPERGSYSMWDDGDWNASDAYPSDVTSKDQYRETVERGNSDAEPPRSETGSTTGIPTAIYVPESYARKLSLSQDADDDVSHVDVAGEQQDHDLEAPALEADDDADAAAVISEGDLKHTMMMASPGVVEEGLLIDFEERRTVCLLSS